MRKVLLASVAAWAIAISGIASVCAQDYPNRPITVVVPFPPGGQVDTVARLLVDRMRASLGQPVIVEHVGGASGSIGTGRVVRVGGRRLHAQHGQLDEPRRRPRDGVARL